MHQLVIVGAGPQGLAAAAHALERGIEPLVLEAGPTPAAAVSEWGHVRLFSAWPELVDPAAVRLLSADGWDAPSDGYPTGGEWIERYLSPVADALGDRVRYGARVTGIGRAGRDLSVDSDREAQPFVIHVEHAGGREERLAARAVIDASGTWHSPNPAGANGLRAPGERYARADGVVSSRIPSAFEAASLAGRHIVVTGAGHSASTAVIELAELAAAHPGTRVTWALRRGVVGNAFGGGTDDELPQRGALGLRAKQAVDDGLVTLVTGFRVAGFERTGSGVTISSEDGRALTDVDRIYALTGFRPDLSFLSEVRLELDMRLQAPVRLAAEVDPNVHSCGSVRATGAAELAHPERDLYIVGAKSYGRAPTFLAMTGYEQVRSVVAQLAGDVEGARRVELTLPDTGVCGGSGLFDGEGGGSNCCAPPQQEAPPQTFGTIPIVTSGGLDR